MAGFRNAAGRIIRNPENISYAKALGQELFSGREYHAARKECPVCGSDLFRLLDENQIECPICGTIGILKKNGSPNFFDSDYRRFSDHEMDEHFKSWLLEMKGRFSDEKDHLKELQKGYQNQSWWVKL